MSTHDSVPEGKHSRNSQQLQVLQLISALNRAFRERDIASLERLFTDDFAFNVPKNAALSKKQMLAGLASGDLVFESLNERLEILGQGDGCIVMGRVRLVRPSPERDRSQDYRFCARL